MPTFTYTEQQPGFFVFACDGIVVGAVAGISETNALAIVATLKATAKQLTPQDKPEPPSSLQFYLGEKP